jgi:hypothetical protein
MLIPDIPAGQISINMVSEEQIIVLFLPVQQVPIISAWHMIQFATDSPKWLFAAEPKHPFGELVSPAFHP